MSGTQVQSLVRELRSHVPHSNHVKGIPYDATEAQRSQIKKDLSYNVIEKIEASKSKHSHIPTLAFSLFICFEKCLRTSIRAGQWATLWFRSDENLSQLHQCPKDEAQNEAQNFPRGWHLGNACLRETSGYYKFCDTFPPHKTQDETHTSLETTQGGPLTSPWPVGWLWCGDTFVSGLNLACETCDNLLSDHWTAKAESKYKAVSLPRTWPPCI